MRQRELIDYCTDDANRCDCCPYDAECDVYFDMYGTTPACEERNHPERYTDEDIGLTDKELAIREQPTIQPERKKGEWSDGYRWQRCSLCKQTGKKSWNYCPNCGADMRGEQDEH